MISRGLLYLMATAAFTSASPLSKRNLAFDDVLLLGDDGTTSVVKDYEWDHLQKRDELARRQPPALPSPRASRDKPARRGCEQSSEVQVLSDNTFLNWDVAMSPVVGAQGGSATVAISEGYSIANSLSVGVSASLDLIEDVLSVSMSIDYSETWTTTQTQSFTFTVPQGQYGLIVSEPRVRRLQGNYLTGCTDSWDSEAFTSDSYSSQSYGDLSWVTGAIRLCNSTAYPVPYCIGNGSHH